MTPTPSPECLPLMFPSTNGHSWRLFLQGRRYSLPAPCHLSPWHPPDSPAGPRGDLEPPSQSHLCYHHRHTPAQQTLLFRETVLLMGPHTGGCPLWTGPATLPQGSDRVICPCSELRDTPPLLSPHPFELQCFPLNHLALSLVSSVSTEPEPSLPVR